MTTRTTTRTIRLDSDIADWLKGKDARLILESCCELVQAGKLKLDDGGVHTSNNDYQDVLNDIGRMVELSGGTLRGFLTDLDIKMEWGEVGLQGGLVKVASQGDTNTVSQEELKNLQDACDEKGQDINEAIRKTAQQIWLIRQ